MPFPKQTDQIRAALDDQKSRSKGSHPFCRPVHIFFLILIMTAILLVSLRPGGHSDPEQVLAGLQEANFKTSVFAQVDYEINEPDGISKSETFRLIKNNPDGPISLSTGLKPDGGSFSSTMAEEQVLSGYERILKPSVFSKVTILNQASLPYALQITYPLLGSAMQIDYNQHNQIERVSIVRNNFATRDLEKIVYTFIQKEAS